MSATFVTTCIHPSCPQLSPPQAMFYLRVLSVFESSAPSPMQQRQSNFSEVNFVFSFSSYEMIGTCLPVPLTWVVMKRCSNFEVWWSRCTLRNECVGDKQYNSVRIYYMSVICHMNLAYIEWNIHISYCRFLCMYQLFKCCVSGVSSYFSLECVIHCLSQLIIMEPQ